jgi:hypothetical protein
VDRHAAATYYVLYRLTQQGVDVSPMSGGEADLVACTSDGSRVVLVRVRTRDGGHWNVTVADQRPSGRNVAYVLLDFDGGANEPSVFVLRGPLVQAMLEGGPGFSRDGRHGAVLEDGREAWHLLRLGGRSPARSEGAVSSSPPL